MVLEIRRISYKYSWFPNGFFKGLSLGIYSPETEALAKGDGIYSPETEASQGRWGLSPETEALAE